MQPTVPEAIVAVLDVFRRVFTKPAYALFQSVIVGLWCQSGPLSLAQMWWFLRVSPHWSSLHDFVSKYAWDRKVLRNALFTFLCHPMDCRLERTADGRRILWVVVDETTDDHRYARKMWGVGVHRNSHGKGFDAPRKKGHCWVVAGLMVEAMSGLWRVLPVGASLYINAASFKRFGHPSEEKYRSREELAKDLLAELPFPEGLVVYVVGDRLYSNAPFLQGQLDAGRHVVTRLKSNAVAYALPAEKRQGTRGPQRQYGEKLNLRQVAQEKRGFRSHTLPLYGKRQTVRLRSLIVKRRGLKAPVQVVVVLGIEGSAGPVFLLCTDTALPAVEVLRHYGGRFAIEPIFRDGKGWGHLGEYHGIRREGVLNFTQLVIVAQAILSLFALQEKLRGILPLPQHPWRPRKPIPTVGQVRQAMVCLWLPLILAGYFTRLRGRRRNHSNFHDPKHRRYGR